MKTGSTLLIASGICVLAFGLGFGATTLIRGITGNTAGLSGGLPFLSSSSGSDNTSGGNSTITLPAAPVPNTPKKRIPQPGTPVLRPSNEKKSPATTDVPENKTAHINSTTLQIEKVDGPVFMVKTRNYSVKVHVKGETEPGDGSVIYELYDDGRKLISSGNSSTLIVPQSQSGKYFVVVKDSKTGDSCEPYEIKGCNIQKMSKSRLEQICNSGDYTTMRNIEAYEISSSLKLSFVGVSDDDMASSIDDICTRISLGIWSSVSIVEIRYDDLNLVEFVKFRVNK